MRYKNKDGVMEDTPRQGKRREVGQDERDEMPLQELCITGAFSVLAKVQKKSRQESTNLNTAEAIAMTGHVLSMMQFAVKEKDEVDGIFDDDSED